MSEVLHEEVSDVVGFDTFSSVSEKISNEDGSGSLNPITAIALVLSFSTLFLQWNRYTASRDAAEYATKIKNQQQFQERKSLQNEEETVDSDNLSCKSENGEEDSKRPSEDSDDEDFEIVEVPAEVEKDMAENYTSSLQDKGLNQSDTDGAEDYNEPVQKTLNDKVVQWRCVCEGGFLPPGMFGGAEAVFRLGTGQCYHKQA